MKYKIIQTIWKIYNKLWLIWYKNIWRMELGNNVSFSYRTSIDSPSRVKIEDGVYLGKDTWLHVESHKRKIQIIIGQGSMIGPRCTITAADQVIIGKKVLFAPNVLVTDHLHAYENISVPILNQGINKISPISVGDGTWLGTNSVILPGVTIGKNCVIGANSVVNFSIPDYCVAVGSPAKVIKKYNHKTKKWTR